MKFDFGLYLLSAKFIRDYPAVVYPELLYKSGRPYACLLIDSHADYFICVPFRSDIRHKNAFLFTGTNRSNKSHSGLDYSKSAIIRNPEYIDSSQNAIVDPDEYNETARHLVTIVHEANEYVDTCIDHVNGSAPLNPRAYSRKYQFSTLPYFHDIMGL